MLNKRNTAAPSTVRLRVKQKQVSAMERAIKGDKNIIARILQIQENIKKYGIINSNIDIEKYDTDQLYEMLYGGSSDYWKSSTFSEQRISENEYINNLTREINVVSSIYICPQCSYDRILVRQEQKGGGDESMTALFRCTKCGYEWSNSGRG